MENNRENTGTPYISMYYQRLLGCAALSHFLYVLEFLWLGIPFLAAFNVGSVLLYLSLQLFARGGRYKSLLLLTHIEVCSFACTATVFSGWNCGYHLLILCVATLVYFCPYRNRYVPYLFSAGEMLIFVFLRIFYVQMEQKGLFPLVSLSAGKREMVYLFNVLFAFLIIIIASVICNISTALSEDELMKKNNALKELALYDPLTGLFNRRAMQPEMDRAVEEFRAGKGFLYLILCDIDDFKKVNDNYGHRCGDLVLRNVADILGGSLSGGGRVCRWGGEEFVVLLPGFSREEAVARAEEMRARVADSPVCFEDTEIRVTMTLGVSGAQAGYTAEDLVRRADLLMYDGKKQGKNCVCAAPETEGRPPALQGS